MDYPRPPFDYVDREPKRPRVPSDTRDPGFDRSQFDERGALRHDYDHPSAGDFRAPLTRPRGQYFLVKTSTAENLAKSRETVLFSRYMLTAELLGGTC